MKLVIMGQRIVCLCLLLIRIISMFAWNGEAQTLSFLINCGSNSSVDVGGRIWIGDSASGSNVTLSAPGFEVSTTGDPVDGPLYSTARFFNETLNYTFPVTPGEYVLRMHFSPLFDRYSVNESYFAIEANGLKLVSKFNIEDELSAKNERSQGNSSYLVKEYFFLVDTNVIVVQFVPADRSFGFVNALEVNQEESELFSGSVRRVGANGVNSSLSSRGIQTMYRLNVGGWSINSSVDPYMRKVWEADSVYMINVDAGLEISNRSILSYANPSDTGRAPLVVYETARALTNAEVMEKRFNMSWKLEVDPDFDYLVRLHFCELVYDMPNQRIFKIYIDNKTAADNYDVFVRAGRRINQAYHEDYIDFVSSKSNSIWIQLGPDPASGAAGTDALLNGLEVFKLSRNGNLAYKEKYDLKTNKASRSLILWIGIGAGIISIAVLAATSILVFCFCKKREKTDNEKGWRPLFLHGSILNSTVNAKETINGQYNGSVRSGRRFTLTEIKSATNNFDEGLIIGVGGFGKVYKAEMDENTLMAIKRSNPQSQQGLAEFETEIEMLSKLRHRHLVSLVGFCDEQEEMILVYEYMSNGTLRAHLFGSDLPPLSWKRRLEACIGAARGLHYLHTGSDQGIIHRDVKTTNILLDENFVAKMADFGLSKTGPSLDHTHVSTAVKGSFGYLDPEYFRRQQLTEKSDVYSFGVVLFEVVCARAVINPTLPKDQINLAEWALRQQIEKSLEGIIDPNLRGKYSPESLLKFGEIAGKCLADEGKSRPTMGEVLWHLEYVLQLHEAWARSNPVDNLDLPLSGESEAPVDPAQSSGTVVQIKSEGHSESRALDT